LVQQATWRHCGKTSFVTDAVEKVFFRVRSNFSGGAGASIRGRRRGTHYRSDFELAAFVSSLSGGEFPNTGFDERTAENFGQFIFAFFDSIDPKRSFGLMLDAKFRMQRDGHPDCVRISAFCFAPVRLVTAQAEPAACLTLVSPLLPFSTALSTPCR